MLDLDKNTDSLYNDLIFLKPIFHNKIWGGRRLAEAFWQCGRRPFSTSH